MGQNPARAQRRRADKAKPVEPEVLDADGAPEQAPEPLSDPAVVVIRKSKEDGNAEVQFMELNGIDPFAVPTLLRAAANIREQQLSAGGK